MPDIKPRPSRAHDPLKVHSVKQAAELLGCSDMHIYRLIAAGEIKALDIAMPGAGRTKTRIRDQDLADYLSRKAVG